MFQSFDVKTDPAQGRERLPRLRQWLEERKLDGFLVPRADEHQGEYVPACSERLRWLTGFTGSAGVAIVMAEKAFLFVDGRYTLQAREQTDQSLFTIESLIDLPPEKWLRLHLAKGMRIGFDPWLHTIGEAERLAGSAKEKGAELVALERNPVDLLWSDRPEPPIEPVEIHAREYAGELAKDKLKRLANAVSDSGAACTVLTDPSSLAWAFNIRGHDVPHTPLALGFAFIAADGAHRFFMDERKLSIEVKAYLTQLADLLPPERLESDLIALAKSGATVALDPVLAADRLRQLVEENGGKVIALSDPARLPRATKNEAEIAGAKTAHRRDGAAVTKFLAWLDRQQPGALDEIGVATALEEYRRRTGEDLQMPLRDISFDTISGAGPNGAIIHYRVTTKTNRTLRAGELYLVDSGAQYTDGTTDITRTIAIGQPTEEMRQRYTLVLKGMIGISMLRFPIGTRGSDIDAVARVALWRAGLDYAHGTGHGVGSYLSVHEGPQRISRMGTEKLLTGMILSNEPGYYKEGHYGIRLENLILVTPIEEVKGGDIAMHGFETLTLAPFDRRLIDKRLMAAEEIAWLDDYHAKVFYEIAPLVDGETLKWLEAATAPLA
ncbi:MAG TPA: aminopeptidase P family protein [Rhizobiaceae bacterium]|nr:aminopeptidase P family protein [Rhizobiaceae bacterium]